MIPDWLQPTLILAPLAAGMFWGVGIPWALVLLPASWRRERIIVLALGMALGPLGVTAWMAVLGTWGRLTLVGTLVGAGALTALGAALASRAVRRGSASGPPATPVEAAALPPAPHRRAQRAIVAGIVLLVLLNLIVSAYWPFIAYDTQWVYGYNARLFVLHQEIPDSLGYYPPLVPLSYTLMQQAWDALRGDPFNDHAARVVVPWFNGTAILMAYVLGRMAFGSRRIAVLTAAVWGGYPHMLAWAGAGDLEIPLTLYMTGAAAFFIGAWRAESETIREVCWRTESIQVHLHEPAVSPVPLVGRGRGRGFSNGVSGSPSVNTESLRLALISGLLLGGALWTKPTGGALALGMALAIGGALIVERFAWRAWGRRLRLGLVAALASAPLGGAWYLRNLVLGHEAVTFPAAYWHDFAQRSGQEFGWPLLIAALVAGGLLAHAQSETGGLGRRAARCRLLPLLALLLLLVAALPSALARVDSLPSFWLWVRGDIGAGGRLTPLEWALMGVGAALLVWCGRGAWRQLDSARRTASGLILALMLPYAVVWFRSFSYHYRLSFAIVPLAGALVAALIDGWLWDWLAARRWGRIAGGALIAGTVALAAAAGVEHTADVWRAGGLADDAAKYDHGNPALMVVVHLLERFADAHGAPVVAIPAEDRLPFFFPTWDIRNGRDDADLPTRLEDLSGVDVFVNTSPGVFLMQRAGLWPNSLQADAAVAEAYHRLDVRGWDGAPWPTVLEPIPLSPDGSLPVDDGNFRYTAFTLNPAARQAEMRPGARVEGRVLFGDFVQFIGHDVVTLDWYRGENITLSLYWRPTESAPPPQDYSLYIHLLDAEGHKIAQWDGVPLQGAYPTRFWRPGESLLDYWVLRLTDNVPSGPAQLRIGLYDPIRQERLPVTIDGAPAGDGLTINTRITVR